MDRSKSRHVGRLQYTGASHDPSEFVHLSSEMLFRPYPSDFGHCVFMRSVWETVDVKFVTRGTQSKNQIDLDPLGTSNLFPLEGSPLHLVIILP